MHAKTLTLSHDSLENLLVCLGPRKQNPLFHWVWIWLWVIYTRLLSGEAVNSCLARRAQQSKRIRARERSVCAKSGRVSRLSGVLQSGWRGGGVGCLVTLWWRKGCVCVCNWSAVAGDLLWGGRNEGGADKALAAPRAHKHIHSLSHTRRDQWHSR